MMIHIFPFGIRVPLPSVFAHRVISGHQRIADEMAALARSDRKQWLSRFDTKGRFLHWSGFWASLGNNGRCEVFNERSARWVQVQPSDPDDPDSEWIDIHDLMESPS